MIKSLLLSILYFSFNISPQSSKFIYVEFFALFLFDKAYNCKIIFLSYTVYISLFFTACCNNSSNSESNNALIILSTNFFVSRFVVKLNLQNPKK